MRASRTRVLHLTTRHLGKPNPKSERSERRRDLDWRSERSEDRNDQITP